MQQMGVLYGVVLKNVCTQVPEACSSLARSATDELQVEIASHRTSSRAADRVRNGL